MNAIENDLTSVTTQNISMVGAAELVVRGQNESSFLEPMEGLNEEQIVAMLRKEQSFGVKAVSCTKTANQVTLNISTVVGDAQVAITQDTCAISSNNNFL